MASTSLGDRSLAQRVNVNSAQRSHFFQAPSESPAHSSAIWTAHVDDGDVPRKRARHDSYSSPLSTPHPATDGTWSTIRSQHPSVVNTPEIASPLPFVNSRYRLAGGLDTPSAILASRSEDADFNFDHTSMRGPRSNGNQYSQDDYFGNVQGALQRERNGHSRSHSLPIQSDGWGKAVVSAVSVVSEVAGKVWEFCKAGAFRGFHAGGSHGRPLQTPTCTPFYLRTDEKSIWQDLSPATGDILDATSNSVSTSLLLPGGFPESDYIADYMSHPSKKIRADSSSSWVLVPSHTPLSRETSPLRHACRKLPPSSSASTPSTRRPASKAGLRRPVLPASRPSLTHSPSLNRPASSASTRSPLASPNRLLHQRTQSYTTDDREGTERLGTEKPESLVRAEAQRYAAQVRREKRDEERALQGFNERLKAMIREGKEALGTRVEVEMEETDGELDESW
ncbi:hypothetical protein MMC19_005232 [Ptychographa xylographoides]|nr:hypothetical protein [Ptychographa xylographoides]